MLGLVFKPPNGREAVVPPPKINHARKAAFIGNKEQADIMKNRLIGMYAGCVYTASNLIQSIGKYYLLLVMRYSNKIIMVVHRDKAAKHQRYFR